MNRPLVNQPSKRPTRKMVSAATVGPLVTAAAIEVWTSVMPGIYPPLAGPAMSALVGAAAGGIAAFVVGYQLVRDRANVLVLE